MKKIRLSLLLFVFIFSISFLSGQSSTGVIGLECNGDSDEIEVDAIKKKTTSTADPNKALVEYRAAVLKNVRRKMKCNNSGNCDTGDDCKKQVSGVGAVDGQYPAAQLKGGVLVYPAQGPTTVHVECACITRPKSANEVSLNEGEQTDPFNDTGDDDTSVRTNGLDDLISIYPNPVLDVLNINFENWNLEGDIIMYLHNSIGQRIKTIDMSKTNKKIKSIDTSTYDGGLYFLTITHEDEVVKKMKFIISDK